MNPDKAENPLSDAESKAFFDSLFPQGFAGADVVAEIAPESWEKSPLLACFHPSPERVYQERVQMHRNLDRLVEGRREREPDNPDLAPKPEPTLEEVRAEWEETPVDVKEEVTELVGKCLWDVFSDNHEVFTAEGRHVDLGSFRSAGSFLHEYLTGKPGMPSIEEFMKIGNDMSKLEEMIGDMGYMRFYMGTVWLRGRADLTPVYQMIFRRLKALGADWEYHFPELGVVDLSGLREETEEPGEYSPSESFAKEQEEKERQEELDKLRSELAESHKQARQEALDQPPPTTVQAYQSVYGRDPEGWPPA